VNSPTVLNSAFNFSQFWDGRAATLEEQAEGPVHNPIEMDTNWQDVIGKLSRDPEYVGNSRPSGLTRSSRHTCKAPSPNSNAA
jgi:cytochrome c peroxidase